MGEEEKLLSRSISPPVNTILIERGMETSSEITLPGTASNNIFKLGHPAFELMQVSITVYGATGILCRQHKTKSKRGKGCKKESKDGTATDSKTGKYLDPKKIDPVSTISSNSTAFYANNQQPPMTAVVSYMKNILSSGTAMETYVPSRPLERLNRPEAPTQEFAASWPGWKEDTQNEEKSHAFTIARVMKQQHCRTAGMAKVSTHAHETIELCVFVGRGKELIPLGVTSFVISGDEEEEVIHNAPLRLPRPGTSAFDKHFALPSKKRKKKQKQKSNFMDDKDETYELDSNAVLQLGVRVFPQSTLTKAHQLDVADNEEEERLLKEVLNELLDDSFIGGGRCQTNSGSLFGTETSKVSDALQDISKQLDIALPQEEEEAELNDPLKKAKNMNTTTSHLKEFQPKEILNDSNGSLDESGNKKEDGYKTLTKLCSTSNANLKAIANLLCGLDMCPGEKNQNPPTLRVSTEVSSIFDPDASTSFSQDAVLPLSLVSSVSDSVSSKGSNKDHYYPSKIIQST